MIDIFDEFPKIIDILESEKIRYTLIGGVAMAFYTEPRFTNDIDFLVYKEDFDRLLLKLNTIGYNLNSEKWNFKNINITLCRLTKFEDDDFLVLDILLANDLITKKIINNSNYAKSNGGGINIARKEDIIFLKKVRNSKQDIIDIEKLLDGSDV